MLYIADLRWKVPVFLDEDGKEIRCRTGDAKITQSGFPYNDLQSDFVIHAVGPSYPEDPLQKEEEEKIDKLLYSAYEESMNLCHQNGIKSVGFSLLSSGIFRGYRTLEDVLRIAVRAIRDNMRSEMEVLLIGFTQEEVDSLLQVSQEVLGEPTQCHQST